LHSEINWDFSAQLENRALSGHDISSPAVLLYRLGLKSLGEHRKAHAGPEQIASTAPSGAYNTSKERAAECRDGFTATIGTGLMAVSLGATDQQTCSDQEQLVEARQLEAEYGSSEAA
jgi:hypothetical protein